MLKCFMMMSFLTIVPPRSCPGPDPGSEELDSFKAPPPLSYRHSRVWRANSLSGWSTHDVLQRQKIKQNLHNSAPPGVWSGLSPCFIFPGVERRGQGSEVSITNTEKIISFEGKVSLHLFTTAGLCFISCLGSWLKFIFACNMLLLGLLLTSLRGPAHSAVRWVWGRFCLAG